MAAVSTAPAARGRSRSHQAPSASATLTRFRFPSEMSARSGKKSAQPAAAQGRTSGRNGRTSVIDRTVASTTSRPVQSHAAVSKGRSASGTNATATSGS